MHHDSAFHARMFVPGKPSYEDPATGSAAAAFAGAIMHFDRPVDGSQRYWIEQGIEMGRPSRIRLELEVKGGNCRRRAHRRPCGQGRRGRAARLIAGLAGFSRSRSPKGCR